MDEFSVNRAFILVVERGGLSAASRYMKTSVTSVARHINSLEATLGVRLLNRNTRRQSLTEAGRIYYENISALLGQFEDIKRHVSSFQEGAKGSLRVHLRTTIGNQVIVPSLPLFLQRYPGISVNLTLTDEQFDLIEHGIDVAVWHSALQDSALISRRLTRGDRVLCCSPSYLERHGEPLIPQDILRHNCLVYLSPGSDNVWRFAKDGQMTELPVAGNFRTSSGIALIAGATSGIGIALLQHSIARDAMAAGKLYRLLSGYVVTPTYSSAATHVVYPHSQRLSPKVRAFIDFLVDLFHESE
jgi:DNA-binding transcriptional LysR family regulator